MLNGREEEPAKASTNEASMQVDFSAFEKACAGVKRPESQCPLSRQPRRCDRHVGMMHVDVVHTPSKSGSPLFGTTRVFVTGTSVDLSSAVTAFTFSRKAGAIPVATLTVMPDRVELLNVPVNLKASPIGLMLRKQKQKESRMRIIIVLLVVVILVMAAWRAAAQPSIQPTDRPTPPPTAQPTNQPVPVVVVPVPSGMSSWGATEWTTFGSVITLILGTLTTSVVAVVKAFRGDVKDAELEAGLRSNSARLDRQGAIISGTGTGSGSSSGPGSRAEAPTKEKT